MAKVKNNNDFENISVLPTGLQAAPNNIEQGLPVPDQVSIAPNNLPDPGLPSSTENLSFNLPQNTGGSSIENAIDTATLGRFTPDGQQGAPADDIAFVNRQVDPLSGEPIALADATNELFMPSLNKDIRVGGTSGQLTGNRDIFVAQGGITPFAALERRRAAQQKAAADRASKLNQFKRKNPKLAKDPRFNDNVLKKNAKHDEEFIARAKQQFGDKWQVALTSPETQIGREYLQGKDNLDLLVDKSDQITDLVAQTQKDIDSGKVDASDATLQLVDNYEKFIGEFDQEGGQLGATDFRGLVNKLQTSTSLDEVINEQDVLENISGEILQRAGVDASGAELFKTTTRFTKDFEDGARTQAKQLKSNPLFRNNSDLEEDDIFQIIMNLKGKVDKRSVKITKKNKADGFTDKSQVPVNNSPKIVNIGDSQFQTKVSVPFSQKTQNAPSTITGAIVLDTNGKPVTRQGQMKFRGVELGVITTKNGVDRRVAFAKEIIDLTGLSGEEKKALGVPNPFQSKLKTIEKDVVLDYDNIEGTLKGQSASAKASSEAFDDVSSGSKRNKMIVSGDNFDSDFGEAFRQSGFNRVEDFMDAAEKQGIDVILNDAAKEKVSGLIDPLRVK